MLRGSLTVSEDRGDSAVAGAGEGSARGYSGGALCSVPWAAPEVLAEQLASHSAVQRHLFLAPITRTHLVGSLARALREVHPSTTSPGEVRVVAGPPSEGGLPTVALRVQ
jgi:hypothetical protein